MYLVGLFLLAEFQEQFKAGRAISNDPIAASPTVTYPSF
jgi:hypothetical protein